MMPPALGALGEFRQSAEARRQTDPVPSSKLTQYPRISNVDKQLSTPLHSAHFHGRRWGNRVGRRATVLYSDGGAIALGRGRRTRT
jgi:hypothetical protein